jgi:quercetin dioxygenase-like cupin family protein
MILLGILALALALNGNGQPATAAGGFTELHRVEVDDTGDLEVVMGLVKRSGESISPKHYHPGGEFGFVLEGTATVASENESPTVLNAGSSFYQPPGEWHVVSTAAEGAKAVVFRILRKGQPMIVVVD